MYVQFMHKSVHKLDIRSISSGQPLSDAWASFSQALVLMSSLLYKHYGKLLLSDFLFVQNCLRFLSQTFSQIAHTYWFRIIMIYKHMKNRNSHMLHKWNNFAYTIVFTQGKNSSTDILVNKVQWSQTHQQNGWKRKEHR